MCRHDSPSDCQELQPLLKALQVPCLSRAVQQSVVPVPGWSGSVELDPIIADCLLALQRYLVHHMPALYQAEQDTVAPLLLNLRYSLCCSNPLLLRVWQHFVVLIWHVYLTVEAAVLRQPALSGSAIT